MQFSEQELKIIIEAQDLASSTFKKLSNEISSLTKKTFDVLNPFNSLQKTLAFVGGTAGFGMLAKSFIDTASAFEQFRVQLETTTGSIQKAQMAMRWISDFTAKTPYELEEVTQAFIKLQAYGIDPTSGALRVLGDTASAMGKSLDQAVEALADAINGEFERLKEFGVRAKTTADQITFYYMKAGKEVSITVRKSAEEIQKALMEIWSDKFAGGMERLSHTFQGMVSNLADYWTQFKNEVMQSGVFQYLENVLELTLQKIEQLKKTGDFDKWAKKTGEAITTAFEGATLTLARIPILMEQAKLSFLETSKFIADHRKTLSGLLGIGGSVALLSRKPGMAVSLFGAAKALNAFEGKSKEFEQAIQETTNTIKKLENGYNELKSILEEAYKKTDVFQQTMSGATNTTNQFANAQNNLSSALQKTLSALDKQKKAAESFQKELQGIMEKVNWQLMTPEQQYNYVKDKLQDLWNEAWSNEDVKAAEEYVETFQNYLDLLSQFEGKESVLEQFRDDLEELSRVFNSDYFEEKKKKLLSGSKSDKLISDQNFRDAKEKFQFIETEINYIKALMPIELKVVNKTTETINQIKTEINNLKFAIDELKNQGITLSIDGDVSELSDIADKLNKLTGKTIEIKAKDEATPIIEKIKRKLDEVKEITIDVKIRKHIENLSVELEKVIRRGQIDLSGGNVG
ncbi:tape measure protein [Desulfurobacterium crinifex]